MPKMLKPMLAVVAVILPALFTWLETRARADEEKIKAAVTYTILQGSVKELQAASYTQALQLARIEGKLDRSGGTTYKLQSKPQDVEGTTDVPAFKEIPDYKDAVQTKK